MDSVVLIQYLKHQKFLVDFTMWSACAVFIYDYILTLHLEIKLIWCSRWSYTKVLFLLVRYMALTAALLVPYGRSTPNLSMVSCRVTFHMTVWFMLVSVYLSQSILAVRTWAIWNMNRMVGVGLFILIVVDAAVRFPIIYIFLKTTENTSPPYSGYTGCFFTKGSRMLWVNYAVMTMIQACFFALMAISAFRSCRRGNKSETSDIIHKDGIMFYIYLLGFGILNLTISLTAPEDMILMFCPMEELMYTMLTSRIVLNIRDAGNRQGIVPELHTGYRASVTPAIPSGSRAA